MLTTIDDDVDANEYVHVDDDEDDDDLWRWLMNTLMMIMLMPMMIDGDDDDDDVASMRPFAETHGRMDARVRPCGHAIVLLLAPVVLHGIT